MARSSKQKIISLVHQVLQEIIREFSYFVSLREDIELLKQQCAAALEKSEPRTVTKLFDDFAYVESSFMRLTMLSHELVPELTHVLNAAVQNSSYGSLQEKYLQSRHFALRGTKPKITPAQIEELYAFRGEINNLLDATLSVADQAEKHIIECLADVKRALESHSLSQDVVEKLQTAVATFGAWLEHIMHDYAASYHVEQELLQLMQDLPADPIESMKPPNLDYLEFSSDFPDTLRSRISTARGDVNLVIDFTSGSDIRTLAQRFATLHQMVAVVWNHEVEGQNLGCFNDAPYIADRMRDPRYITLNQFNLRCYDFLLVAMDSLLQNNLDLVRQEGMTFTIEIAPENDFSALMYVKDNRSDRQKKIVLGLDLVYYCTFFQKDPFTVVNREFVRAFCQVLSGVGSENSVQGLIDYANQVWRFSGFSGTNLYISGSYRGESLYMTLYHEFVHAVDPHAIHPLRSVGYSHLDPTYVDVNSVFSYALRVVVGRDVDVYPADWLKMYDRLFVDCRVEALTVFAEHYVRYRDGTMMNVFRPTFPLYSTTERLKAYLTYSITNISSLPTRSEVQTPSGASSPFSYEMGYMLSMIILLQTIFARSKTTIICARESIIRFARPAFPISYAYLGGKRNDFDTIHEFESGIDAELFTAIKTNDSAKIRELFESVGIEVISSLSRFKKFYLDDVNFYVGGTEEFIYKEVQEKIRLSEANFFLYYLEACEFLGIDSLFDDPTLKQLFFVAIDKHNTLTDKKPIKRHAAMLREVISQINAKQENHQQS